MDDAIITLYCLCDDFLRSARHRDDPQRLMTDAEVMTTALVAALYFGGNLEAARRLLDAPTYIPTMLSKSRLNRRLHAIQPRLRQLFDQLAEGWKHQHASDEYVIDSFPVPVCDNIRIRRCRLIRDEAYRGYTASKRRYFYGFKTHLLVTTDGHPIECFFSPGSMADVAALPCFTFDLPPESRVYADAAYTHYDEEDLLVEAADIRLCAARRKNSTRPIPPWEAYWRDSMRKKIETTISVIQQRFPKTIHAVTPGGFVMKLFLFVLAHSVAFLL